MKIMHPSFLIIGLAIIILLLFYIVYIYCTLHPVEHYIEFPAIFCILVTGKTNCRNLFGKQSIQNFFEQDYPNKQLIIINHGKQSIIGDVIKSSLDKVNETMVDKGEKSLGDLRNMALGLVTEGSYWTTWDDDDYRPPHYISWMYDHLKRTDADLLAYTHRYEYNYNTGFFWETVWKTGFVTCLARKVKQFKYKSLNSMEDTDLLNDYRRFGHRVVVLSQNDPSLYIRLVHGNNTSQWVDPLKNKINKNTGAFLEEKQVSDEIKFLHTKFILDYYKDGLSCMQSS